MHHADVLFTFFIKNVKKLLRTRKIMIEKNIKYGHDSLSTAK